jgi:hypothetical protein
MWRRLDDLLSDVQYGRESFPNIKDDLGDAFKVDVARCEKYTKLINSVLYFAAPVLDLPRNNQQQYADPAMGRSQRFNA